MIIGYNMEIPKSTTKSNGDIEQSLYYCDLREFSQSGAKTCRVACPITCKSVHNAAGHYSQIAKRYFPHVKAIVRRGALYFVRATEKKEKEA